MGWLATVRLEILKLAVVVPPLVVTLPWPMFVPPSEKVTTPVGVPGPVTDTVAVKVTFWPQTDGLTEDTTAVVVFPLPTDCVTVPVLARKLLSPPYEAVRVWLPTARLEVLKLAVVVPALVVNVPWPRLVPPSEKTTRPVGLPGPLPVTVAAKVTFWPEADGLTEDTTTVVLLALLTVCVKLAVLARKLLSPL